MVVACLRYEQAIVLPKRDGDASVLVWVSIIFGIFFSLTLFLVILFFRSELIKFLNLSSGKGFILYLVPLGTFLLSAFQVFNYWLIRKKGFGDIAINKFTRRVFEGGAQSFFAFTHYQKGLVIGDVIGQIANATVSAWQSFQRGLTLKNISLSRVRHLLVRYSDFPKYSLVPSLLSAACFMLPVIFINKYYTAQQAGYLI